MSFYFAPLFNGLGLFSVADIIPKSPHFYRPTWAEINLGAFRENLEALGRLLPPSVGVLAVLKADGYGHGAVALAREAVKLRKLPLWGFGVSSVEEGVVLRRAGIRQRVLILGSLFPFESFRAALKHGLTPTIASRAAALVLARKASRLKRPMAVHLKVDTGMGRIGMSPATAIQTAVDIVKTKGLCLQGVYTHLAQGDVARPTRVQLGLFGRVLESVRRVRPGVLGHVANSAAAMAFPESHYDLVRPGLALYGVFPAPQLRFRVKLSPVLTWKTRVVFLKAVPVGTAVSYGGTFRTARPSRLATLPVGYGDGYKRSLSNRAQVLMKGRRCPVVGRVTMDQIVVDVTDVPGVKVGEETVLLGAQGEERVSAEELAVWADTVPYEILCGITARVPRIVIAGRKER